MAKLSRECWACAARRDRESFDRSTSVARVPLTFMGKLSDLVMAGAVFCVISSYQRYSAIGLSDSIVSLSYWERCSHSMREFNRSSNGWFQELHFWKRWYWIFESSFNSYSRKGKFRLYFYDIFFYRFRLLNQLDYMEISMDPGWFSALFGLFSLCTSEIRFPNKMTPNTESADKIAKNP